jgi:hypothetical protein
VVLPFFPIEHIFQYQNLTYMQTIAILILLIAGMFIYSYLKSVKMPETILSHWHHRFEIVPFSSQEFYQGVKEALAARALRHVSICGISYTQGGFLSPRRDYLRIQYKEFIYDVCAAPFGKEYFVSWWLGEVANPVDTFMMNIPFIGRYYKKRKKTFFELDTEIMFKETVSVCVKETIEQLTQTKGMRQLADADWKEYNRLHN